MAEGTATFTASLMEKPGVSLMGITAGADPLQVVLPVMPRSEVSHTSFFAGMPNRVVFSIQLNIDLSPEESNNVVDARFIISGLQNMAPEPTSILNTTASGGVVVTLDPSGDQPGDFLFCTADYPVRSALWDPVAFTLTLRVCSSDQPFRAVTRPHPDPQTLNPGPSTLSPKP